MKAEAEAIQKQNDERDRKAKDDEERARLRRKKWAVLTMQGYMRTYLARKLVRQRAYKRYIKHFDPVSHNYYYEDRRTHETSWEKPTCLGSYDITMENYWILMRATTATGEPVLEKVSVLSNPEDPESEKVVKEMPLVYYYNPSTWKQTWQRPEGTVMCDMCGVDFAQRRLNYDMYRYCETCFASAAQALVNSGMHPKYVTFKTFQGGSERATRMDLESIPDESWFMLIMDANPALKQSEEEEVAAVKRARKRALAGSQKSEKTASGKTISRSQRSGKYGQPKPKNLVELCGICDDRIAILNCRECETLYCQSCCDVAHSIASHAFHEVVTYIPEIDKGAFGTGEEEQPKEPSPEKSKKSKKSKKSRKSRRHKSDGDEDADGVDSAMDSAAESGAEGGDDAADESWLNKPNSGKHILPALTAAATAAASAGDLLGNTDEDAEVQSGAEKKPKKHKKKKHRKDGDSGAVSDYTESDVDGLSTTASKASKASKRSKSSSGSKHKKHRKDRTDADSESRATAASSDGTGKKDKKHKRHKDRTEGDPSDAASASTSASKHKKKHKKDKHRDGAGEGEASDGGSKASKHSKGSKHSSHSKGSKHKKKDKRDRTTDGNESVMSALSDTDAGYSTAASTDTKRSKDKKKHKHLKQARDDGDAASAVSAESSPKKKKNHKHSKGDGAGHKTSKADGAPLGGEFADAFAQLTLNDSAVEGSEASPKKSHKKKHKKDKKDTAKAQDDVGFSSAEENSPVREKKAKKHKKDKVDHAYASEGGGLSSPDKHQKKHKRDKHRDEAPLTSSSFKLPDIFRKNNTAPSAPENSLFDHSNEGEKRPKKHKHSKGNKSKTPEASDLSSPDSSPSKHKHHKSGHRSKSAPAGEESAGFSEGATEHKHKHKKKHSKSKGSDTEGAESDGERARKHKHKHGSSS